VSPGRNEPCPCGSGKKYKRCCGQAQPAAPAPPPARGAGPAGSRAAPPPADLGTLAALMNAGRYAEAETLARMLVERQPSLAIAWKMRGVALTMLGRDAVPALQTASRLQPADAETHYYLGNALQAQGRPADAEAHYRRATEIRPGLADAHNELGRVLLQAGRLDAAIGCFERALAVQPAFAAALGNLANALRASGRVADAVAGYRRVLAIDPGLAEAHNNLGSALLELGERDEALACYRRALERRPGYLEALGNLTRALRGCGRLEEAVSTCRRMLALRPDSTDTLNELGNLLVAVGRFDEAAACYRRALALRPDDADAHSNLGNALRSLGELHAAADSCRRAVALKPGSAEAHLNLGNVLLDLSQLREAEASYRQALAIRPDDAATHTVLAMLLRRLGRADDAEASCRRALAINPSAADTLAFLGDLRADRGEFAQAEELCRRAIAINPGAPEAWIGIPRYRKMTAADADWLSGAERLLGAGLPVGHEINLRHAIGKYFDDLHDYAQAFASHRLANERTRKYGLAYDRARQSRLVGEITTAYDAAWLEATRRDGSESERPVFIVGMPRSGTTLAEQILASHPAVCGAGELVYWNIAQAAFDPSTPAERRAAIVAGLAREYLGQLTAYSADALRVVDKMPGNFANLGLIHAALPRARIIHMQRNPIDTCLSIYFQGFSTAHPYAADLEDLAHYYGEYRRLLAHWRSVLPPGALLEVPYEALVEDPEGWSRKMVGHARLPWDPRCLEFHRTDRAVLTASNWQVRQKISTASVGRWRRYEQFVGPLRRLLG
jgi:tetratricopeptide (TPR) repeat protein